MGFLYLICKVKRISYVEQSSNEDISKIGCILGWTVSCGQKVIQILHCNLGNLYHKSSWSSNISILKRILVLCRTGCKKLY